MTRLDANENFPLPAVEQLRLLGHDVLTTQEAGEAGRALPDEQVSAFAINEGRALLTLKRKHFVHLHHANPNPAGIIVCSFDSDFKGQVRRIHAAIDSEERLSGGLIGINRPQQ